MPYLPYGNPTGAAFFTEECKAQVPNSPGTYSIYSTNLQHDRLAEHYVGTSNDLQRRFGEHLSNFEFIAEISRHPYSTKIVMFEWWIILDEQSRKSLELDMIRGRDPLINKTGN